VKRGLLTSAIGEDAVDLVCHRRHLELSTTDGERLRAAITGVVRMTERCPELLTDAREVARIRSWLFASLVGCMRWAEADDGHEQDLQRKACVHRAIDLVDRSSAPTRTLELAQAVGVSLRTLEHGFRELLGVTPAGYLRRHRMNRAHHDLSHADPRSQTVLEIALKWGFSHASRFSAEYRALFGVLPSETLRQTPRDNPCRPLSRIVE